MLRLVDILPAPQSLAWPQYVVYDVDSTLWDLDHVAPRTIDIDPRIFNAIYNFRENPNLTEIQIALLEYLFEEPALFERMKLYPGSAKITKVQELGLKVAINSNCQNSRVISVKRRKLLEQIPTLDPGLIFLNDLSGGHDCPKQLDANTTLILVEDSPYNVASSTAKLNILKKVPWNQSGEAQEIMKGKPVISFDTVVEINDYIYHGIKEWLEYYNFTPPTF